MQTFPPSSPGLSNGTGSSSSGGGSSGSNSYAGPPSTAARFWTVWRSYDLGNWSLLILLVFVLVAIEQNSPHHRIIININDPTISYPLQPQQVPIGLLLFLVEVIPILIILFIYWLQRRSLHAKRELYHVLFGFVYSMILTLIITEFIKRMSGRPRPNFIALSGYQANGQFTASASKIANAFQSFPSGHTSTAFSGLGYLSIYLFKLCFPTHMANRDAAEVFHINQGYKTVLCISPLVLATWIGITRIVDYYHNFDDVSIGGLIGMSVAMLTFQLHVGWMWKYLHSNAVLPVAGGELPPRHGAYSHLSDSDAGSRRNSGPSHVYATAAVGQASSNSSRKSAIVAPLGDEHEESDSPLLEDKV